MKRVFQIVLAGALTLLGSGVWPATADPVTVHDGFVSVYADPSSSFGVDLVFYTSIGDFVGESEWASRYLDDFYCYACTPVRTNSTLHLTFSRADVLDHSSNSACPGCGYDGDFTFTTAPLPLYSDRVPFQMTGTFAGFAPGTGSEVFRVEVAGSGGLVASERLAYFAFAAPAAETPEPASLLLLGTGAAALFARRRARRSATA